MLLVSIASAAPPESSANTSAVRPTSIKAMRKAAADRRRRILINNDGGAVSKRLPEATAQAILDDDTTPLIGTQVDTILYCTKSSGFSIFTHFTKVGQIFTSREDIFANNKMEELLKAGIDPLRVMVDFGKQHGIEIFWSMRMNDTHDGSRTSYGPVMFGLNKLKQEHPEYLIGTANERPKYGAWTAVDYARPEIRDLAFRYCEEVCRNYDVDGIELDFSRHPVFFKSTARGEHTTDAERAAMTDLMQRIRTMADHIGQKRGRPILIAMRVPDSVEYSRAIGLDLEKWLADDLLDLLVVSSYFQLNDWDYSVRLARKHGVKIYPSLDESRAGDEIGKAARNTPQAYRARAAEVWAAGADGVYVFNAPDEEWPIWREMGDAKTLAKLDKDYFASPRGVVDAAGRNLPIQPFQKIETLNPKQPKKLSRGKTAAARINIAQDFSADDPPSLKLRLRFNAAPSANDLRATINGHELKLTPSESDWLEGTVLQKDVKSGANQVELTLGPKADAKSVEWLDCILEVRHAQTQPQGGDSK
jgi:hypothetical protein